jgi:transcriptional regulator with PAS, ATPase and Fis domain
VLNCAALPADLLDAELFGIEAGVATGVSARAGRFELAHGGSLFLDEIGDMSLDTQARILRVLQEREVYRVGSHQPRPADVRVISASNRDLQALVREGRFRLDLYHRIADWRAELPPLRARREDIPNLAAQFLGRALQARGLIGGGLTQGAVDALLRYRWPGNVRELEREMQRAALFLNEGEALPSGMLKAEILTATDVAVEDESLSGRLAQEERRIIAGVLAQHAGDIAAVAERLGVSKSTLYRRLASLGLPL